MKHPIAVMNQKVIQGAKPPYAGHRDQRWGPTTYAQHGDDLMLINIFEMLEIDKPSYIDVGAHHPINISNTKLLYDRGSRGVNIEANPKLIEEFNKHRPHDTNINVGIGVDTGRKTFYMYSDTSGRNTFSEKETQEYGRVVKKKISLEVVTLDSVVTKCLGGVWPHILTIDIEGLDYEVLWGAQFHGELLANAPMVVCVETRRTKDETDRMTMMMGQKGYAKYCRMGENLFFVRRFLYERLF